VEHHQLGFLQADKRIFMDTTKTFLEPENAKPERWVFGSGQQIPGIEVRFSSCLNLNVVV
jgi:hypothetical protein